MQSSVGRERIGLIAGNGRFPILFAQAARNNNFGVLTVAIKGDTHRSLGKLSDKIYWLDISDFNRLFYVFKEENISKVVMAGQINPLHLFGSKIKLSPQLKELLDNIKDKRADTIFGAIADKLKQSGITLEDSRMFLQEFIPKSGVLTKTEPSINEWEDIRFGYGIAKAIGAVDIGQTVVIKNKIIVAVESIEGTDASIRRAGHIAGKGCVVVKTAKPKQDMRFDVPLVGLRTLKNLSRIKASCLALEAEKSLILDKELFVKMADKMGLKVVVL